MTLSTIESPAQSRIRIAGLLETERLHITRMAEKAAIYAANPRDQWARYAFLDALSFVEPSAEIAETMAMLRHEELRIDADGYALDDAGDRTSVLRYIHMVSLCERGEVA